MFTKPGATPILSTKLHHNHCLHQTAAVTSPGRQPADKSGAKWTEEDMGPVSGDGLQETTMHHPSHSRNPPTPTTISGKIKLALKILLPHVGLTSLLLSYIAAGAVVFQWLETEREMERRTFKVGNISRIYTEIVNASLALCSDGSTGDERATDIEKIIRGKLLNLSLIHEYDENIAAAAQLWEPDRTVLETRWTFQAAVLYALTVISTTGYDHISPLTDYGRMFTVLFGLFGIPLMFITAADIGKFLSDCVTALYYQLVGPVGYIRGTVFGPVCRRICPSAKHRNIPSSAGTTPNGDLVTAGTKDTIDVDDDPDPTALNGGENLGPVQLPIVAYFCLILGYCAIGSLMFNHWEDGRVWSFIYGFFFSFNTITTIGLGNIRVFNFLYLLLIVFYVIVGLAVITMCVDLASSQLKILFTRLHYFGRKFRGAHGALMHMSDDIREAIKIIHALKRTRAAVATGAGGGDGSGAGLGGGPVITLGDIKRFLEIEQKYSLQPFVPQNANFLRWVDDEGDEASSGSARSASINKLKHVSSDPALHM